MLPDVEARAAESRGAANQELCMTARRPERPT